MKLFARRKAMQTQELSFRSTARSHIGKVRSVNEDRLLDCPGEHLWAIADGMGGHHRGDKAATMVVRALAQVAETAKITSSAIVAKILEDVNTEVRALTTDSGHICGSTVAALHIERHSCTVLWVGDSRVYRFRNAKLQRLSRDHSVVQDMTDKGLITEAESQNHPLSNVITRAIGIENSLHIEQDARSVKTGDLFLLCSDGLSGAIDDRRIATLLSSDLERCANTLLSAALDAGGRDNISFILVQVS